MSPRTSAHERAEQPVEPDGASPVLRVEDVSVELGGRLVLDQARLAVARGELLGLIGPNGAGKTTLLRTILGLQRPRAGRVLIDGRPTRPGRTAIGYVPQRHEFAWEFPISVAEVVITGLSGALGLIRRPGARDWQQVAQALDLVRMRQFAERPVGQLSGGQRQRVLVARALVLQPSLLLLDEPFTGLDMPTQELLQELFIRLAREGRALVMTTHDIPSALVASDRIALLNRRVLATGAPAELAADAALWQRAFGVGEDSVLLRLLRAAL